MDKNALKSMYYVVYAKRWEEGCVLLGRNSWWGWLTYARSETPNPQQTLSRKQMKAFMAAQEAWWDYREVCDRKED